MDETLVVKTLEETWGYSQLHSWQKRVLGGVMNDGKDAVVVQATGSGKSLVYQIPPLVAAKGGWAGAPAHPLAIVISPLIALMEDQTARLRSLGVPAVFLGSAQADKGLRPRLLAGADAEILGLRILYMSPEYASNILAADLLARSPALLDRIVLIAVDEAHCVSKWGHEFRPAYKALPPLLASLRSLKSIPYLALTATATQAVIDDLARGMGLVDPLLAVGSFARPNLHVSFATKSHIDHQLVPLLTGPDSASLIPSIVYVRTRKSAERIAKELGKARRNMGRVSAYHAGFNPKLRTAIQTKFSSGHLDIVVCTVAFGMGIDIANIRSVLHYGAPDSVEGYYQQIGRGGRDGNLCTCVCFWTSGDFHSALNGAGLDASHVAHRVRSATFLSESVVGNTDGCRKQALVAYFGQTMGKCGMCDVCDNSAAPVFDYSKDAYVYLSALQAIGEYAGPRKAIALLLGRPPKQRPSGSRWMTLINAGIHHSKAWWASFGSVLATKGFVKVTMVPNSWGRGYERHQLTPKARAFVSSQNPDQKHPDLFFAATPDLLLDASTARVAFGVGASAKVSSSFVGGDGSGSGGPGGGSDGVTAQLMAQLRRLRIELAHCFKRGIDEVQSVLTDGVLEAIATSRPAGMDKLVALEGVSPEVGFMYGSALLQSVSPFVSSAAALHAHNLADAKASLDLFQKRGLSLQSVANARGLPLPEVLRQFRWCVELGIPFQGHRLGWTEDSIRAAVATMMPGINASTSQPIDETISTFVMAYREGLKTRIPSAPAPGPDDVVRALLSPATGGGSDEANAQAPMVRSSSTSLALIHAKRGPGVAEEGVLPGLGGKVVKVKSKRHRGNALRRKRKRSVVAPPAAMEAVAPPAAVDAVEVVEAVEAVVALPSAVDAVEVVAAMEAVEVVKVLGEEMGKEKGKGKGKGKGKVPDWVLETTKMLEEDRSVGSSPMKQMGTAGAGAGATDAQPSVPPPPVVEVPPPVVDPFSLSSMDDLDLLAAFEMIEQPAPKRQKGLGSS